MEEDVGTKERVQALLISMPGVSTARVARELDVDVSTADHHLRRLARSSVAVREPVGREACWFAARSGYCPLLLRAIPTLRRPGVREVARALEEYAQSAPRIAESSGVEPGQVRWAATALVGCGIAVRARGGQVMLAPGARVCMAKALRGERCGEWGKCAPSKAWATSSSPSPSGSRA